MKNETYSFKEVLIALTSLYGFVEQLALKGKRYESLLNEILKYSDKEDNSPLPTSKELQAITGLNNQNCKAYLVEIYQDTLELINIETSKKKFEKVRYEWYASYYDQHFHFSLAVPVVPRIGEHISLPFLKPIFDLDWFYVEDIQHLLENGCQTIEISLRGGKYNLHERIIVDKAKYEDWYDYKKREIIGVRKPF